jgi:hypothetical protein
MSMNLKLKSALILAALALLASGLTAFANQGNSQRGERDSVTFEVGDIEGESTLLRNNNGVQMRLNASGLEPGDVATVWWVLFDGDEIRSAFYAAGSVVGGSGKANFAAHLPEGRITVDPDFDANQLVMGEAEDAILGDARDEDVMLVLRTHGPKIPGLMSEMLSTHDAGCTSAMDGVENRENHPLLGEGDLPHLAGPNTCMNLAMVLHEAE